MSTPSTPNPSQLGATSKEGEHNPAGATQTKQSTSQNSRASIRGQRTSAPKPSALASSTAKPRKPAAPAGTTAETKNQSGSPTTAQSSSVHLASREITITTNDPKAFGRIDDEGKVWLRQGTEEQVIGEWKAGTQAEGLTHFGRRFEALVTEAELLIDRLGTHPSEAADIQTKARELKETAPKTAGLGDFAALDSKLAALIEDADVVAEKEKEAKAQRREKALQRRRELISEAQDIAENSTQWKESGERLRSMLGEWKAIRGIDRKTDDSLWEEFTAARDSFHKRRGAHFAELDRKRAKARDIKEEICLEAEAIQNSTDWNATAKKYRDLMQQWKAAGRAPRETDDKLWARFRAAQDVFFEARNADQAAKDKEFEDNARAKEELIEAYSPQIDPEKDLDSAKKALKELRGKWEEIGYVPRGRVKEFEDKIGELERRVAEAEEDNWRKTDPELQARLAQFQSKADELNQAADEAQRKGNTKKEQELREQAQQWSVWAQAAQEAVE